MLSTMRRCLLVVVTFIVAARFWLLEPHVVRGTSMWPTYADGDYLLIDKLSVRWLPLQRGDVVMVHHPREPRTLLMKRVVGLPGDTVVVEGDGVSIESSATGRIRIDGQARRGGRWRGTLASEEIFVLGDRRSASIDSRAFGAVPLQSVVGRVLLRIGRLPPLLR